MMKRIECGLMPCAISANETSEKIRVRLMPDGHVPSRNEPFEVTREGFDQMLRSFNEGKVRIPVDYHHNTTRTKEIVGGKAPAAGWIEGLEYVAGEGVYGLVEWTAEAREEIRSKKFQYLSPVVMVDKSKVARELHSAALTNKPAIPGMDVLAAEETEPDGDSMMPLFKQLAQKMGLAENASQEDILKAAIGKVDGAAGAMAIANSVRTKLKLHENAGESEVLTALAAQAEASTAAPELTKLRAELDTLKAHEATRTAETLREKFVKANKINPANTEMMANALDWAKKDPTGFEKFFNSADALVPAGRTVAPARQTAAAGGDEDTLIANAMTTHKNVAKDAYADLQRTLIKNEMELGKDRDAAIKACEAKYPKIFG